MTRFLLVFLLVPVAAHAQHTGPAVPAGSEAQADSVRAHVVDLFDAMRSADGDAVLGHFHERASLYSVSAGPDGLARVQVTDIERFAEAVGGDHPEYDERIGPVEVRMDGALATAYMPYAFYVGGEFSHCGVNAFHLVRTAEGWRTLHITDTRRRAECDPSVSPD